MIELIKVGGLSRETAEKRVNEIRVASATNGAFWSQDENGFFFFVLNDLSKFLLPDELEKAEHITHHAPALSCPPVVFRFIDEKYVDKFFENGELMISTFSAFAQSEDPLRKDIAEGRAKVEGLGERYRFESEIGVGFNSYILCTALSRECEDMDGNLYKCAIAIYDLPMFIDALTHELENKGIFLTNVWAGPCVYNERIITRIVPDEEIEKVLKSKDAMDIMNSALQAGGTDIFFRKPIKKKQEHEYRIVLNTTDEVREPVFVNVPAEVRKFCKKIKIE